MNLSPHQYRKGQFVVATIDFDGFYPKKKQVVTIDDMKISARGVLYFSFLEYSGSEEMFNAVYFLPLSLYSELLQYQLILLRLFPN